MSRSMQLHYISVTAFSWTDLFLNRIYFEWDSRGSAITNHKTLIDVTALLDRNCLSLHKRKGVLKIDQSVKMPWHRLSMGVANSCSSAPDKTRLSNRSQLRKPRRDFRLPTSDFQLQAPSTRIRKFVKTQIFFYDYGLRPHVSSVFSARIRKFLKTLSRVEIFLSDTNSYTCGRSYPQICEYAYVIFLSPVFTSSIINKHGVQQGCIFFVNCSDF